MLDADDHRHKPGGMGSSHHQKMTCPTLKLKVCFASKTAVPQNPNEDWGCSICCNTDIQVDQKGTCRRLGAGGRLSCRPGSAGRSSTSSCFPTPLASARPGRSWACAEDFTGLSETSSAPRCLAPASYEPGSASGLAAALAFRRSSWLSPSPFMRPPVLALAALGCD